MPHPEPGSLADALDLHRRALAACTACAFGADVRPIVSEARSPRVLLVGRAPGRTETAGGRPFAGRAGRTLFRWLERAGIGEEEARRAIYIAAVTRCYPGAAPSGRGDRVPGADEQTRCAPWLERELALIRPAILIPVGRLAITRLVGAAPLVQLIGREHPVSLGDISALAIPLPHPSGASSWIHAPGHAALLEDALALLRSRLAENLY